MIIQPPNGSVEGSALQQELPGRVAAHRQPNRRRTFGFRDIEPASGAAQKLRREAPHP
jgi:hypothetical protein